MANKLPKPLTKTPGTIPAQRQPKPKTLNEQAKRKG